jgi:hypothetical protein
MHVISLILVASAIVLVVGQEKCSPSAKYVSTSRTDICYTSQTYCAGFQPSSDWSVPISCLESTTISNCTCAIPTACDCISGNSTIVTGLQLPTGLKFGKVDASASTFSYTLVVGCDGNLYFLQLEGERWKKRQYLAASSKNLFIARSAQLNSRIYSNTTGTSSDLIRIVTNIDVTCRALPVPTSAPVPATPQQTAVPAPTVFNPFFWLRSNTSTMHLSYMALLCAVATLL